MRLLLDDRKSGETIRSPAVIFILEALFSVF